MFSNCRLNWEKLTRSALEPATPSLACVKFLTELSSPNVDTVSLFCHTNCNRHIAGDCTQVYNTTWEAGFFFSQYQVGQINHKGNWLVNFVGLGVIPGPLITKSKFLRQKPCCSGYFAAIKKIFLSLVFVYFIYFFFLNESGTFIF